MLYGGMISVGREFVSAHCRASQTCSLRHLTIVRNAFAGTPTLMRQTISKEESFEATFTSDIL